MASNPVPESLQLQALLSYPREDIGVEYKDWLDLTAEAGRATLAKAAIALANHGGGYVVLGFRDAHQTTLQPSPQDPDLPQITQDNVNTAVGRYTDPPLHCQLFVVQEPQTSVSYPVIRVPASDVPVMASRDQNTAGVGQHKIYIRRPGPKSEEPQNAAEWRTLLDRCVWARRQYILDAIRDIVLGVETGEVAQDLEASLSAYCDQAFQRWQKLTEQEPSDSALRFPHGFYEIGLGLIGAVPTESLTVLKEGLEQAQRIKLHGWPIFLDMSGVEWWEPHVSEGLIEAWMGHRNSGVGPDGPGDFWCVSPKGELYTIVGYSEDADRWGPQRYEPGKVLYGDIPIIKLAEGLLFVNRLAKHFEGVQQIGVRCRFTGLDGRGLIWVDSWEFDFRDRGPVCYDPEVCLTGQVRPNQIEDNLPEAVQGMLKPLYERFAFFDLSVDRTQKAIRNLRGFRNA